MNSHRFLLFVLFVLLTACGEEEPDFRIADASDAPARGNNVRIIEDEVGGIPIVVAGSSGRGFVVSFRREDSNGVLHQFTPVERAFPLIMEDEAGNRYDIFGVVREGPNQGARLVPTYGMMGYWFAVGTFYENVSIYNNDEPGAEDFIPEATGAWCIPQDEVFLITARDAIPAIDNPDFVSDADPGNPIVNSPLRDDDLVLGVKIGETMHLYPHRILDWHEIVNDELEGLPFSLIYCPLTGTGNAWKRGATTFGVSGLLYNTNILPYDRATETIWSQLAGKAVFGNRANETPEPLHVVEMPWGQWKAMYQTPALLSFETGFRRDYTEYPYGDYRTNNAAINFPILYLDERLPAKERVHFVRLGGATKAYRITSF